MYQAEYIFYFILILYFNVTGCPLPRYTQKLSCGSFLCGRRFRHIAAKWTKDFDTQLWTDSRYKNFVDIFFFMEGIDLAEDRDSWPAFVECGDELWGFIKCEEFFDDWASQDSLCSLKLHNYIITFAFELYCLSTYFEFFFYHKIIVRNFSIVLRIVIILSTVDASPFLQSFQRSFLMSHSMQMFCKRALFV